MQKYLITTWRLWKLLKPFHKDFYIQLISTIFQQAIGVLMVFIISKILDKIVNKDFNLAYYFIFSWLVIQGVLIIMSYFSDKHAQDNLDFRIQQHLEEYSFKNIFKLNPSQYAEDHSAIKLQVVNRGESAVQNIVTSFILSIFPTFTQIIFSLAAISFYSVTIAAWCAGTLMLVILWSGYFARYHRPFIKKDMDNWDTQRKIRSEIFQHLLLVKNLAVEKVYLKKYLKNREVFIDYKIFTWTKSVSHAHKRWFLFSVSKTGSTILIIFLASLGNLTIGAIYAIWMWINDAYNNIFSVIKALRQIPLRFVELDKYLEIIDKEPDFQEESDTKFVDGDIVFKNLSFKYPKSESDVLSNINIKIPKGSKVAFVGHSGSGKTTITRLLLRAYDYNNLNNKSEEKSENNYSGIKINNIELKDIDAGDLRKHIGYVEQHVDLFDDTVKNNILFGVDEKILKEWEKEQAIDSKVEEISKLARIDEFYHRLGVQKFETEIGERGIKLSGGERQRIGIARAIIKNPSILIFDEATSSLDTVNEKYIKEAIDNVSKGRTTIIIAHRLSTIIDSDIIFVMDKGQVVASGTHVELLENSTHYQDLIQHQELK